MFVIFSILSADDISRNTGRNTAERWNWKRKVVMMKTSSTMTISSGGSENSVYIMTTLGFEW